MKRIRSSKNVNAEPLARQSQPVELLGERQSQHSQAQAAAKEEEAAERACIDMSNGPMPEKIP